MPIKPRHLKISHPPCPTRRPPLAPINIYPPPQKFAPMSVDEGMVRAVGDYVSEFIGKLAERDRQLEEIKLRAAALKIEDREKERAQEKVLARFEDDHGARRESTIRWILPLSAIGIVGLVATAILAGKVADPTGLIVAVGTLIIGAVSGLSRSPLM